MKSKISLLLLAAIAIACIVYLGCLPASAQDATSTPAAVTAAGVPTAEIPSALVELLTKYSWASTALAVFGALSVVYQALIAWAHKRAAETTETEDDQWLASLEAKWWFRTLDRLFYWGGYLGAKLGGKKL